MNTVGRILLVIVTCLLVALAVVQMVGVGKHEGAVVAVVGTVVFAAILAGLYCLGKAFLRFISKHGEARLLAEAGGLSPEELRSLPGYGRTAGSLLGAVLVLLLILAAISVLSLAGMAAASLASHGGGIANVIGMLLAGMCFLAAMMVVVYLLSRLATTWARRRATERTVIGQIAAVARQRLPLSTGLALAAESEQGWPRIHLSRIARLLAQGIPLSHAVRIGYPDCSGLTLSLIVAGEQGGQLPAAIEQAEHHLIEQAQRSKRVDDAVWPYVLIVMTLMVLVVSGIMVLIVPKYMEIFQDFGTRLPRITVALIEVSSWFAEYGIVVVWPLFILCPLALYWSLRPRRVPEPAWSSRVADWVRWHVPGWRTMAFGEGMAAMLAVMRIGVRAGMDVGQAARLATGIDANVLLRPRMARFAEMVTEGTALKDAAMRAELGDATGVALATGQRSGDMDGALRYAVDYHASLMSRVWVVMRNLAWPVCTLLMAALVGFVVVALFSPLVALINSVAM